MNSFYLKTFVEVVTTGSITRAADNLFVTQPAITRRIKLLEEYYGIPLLDRSGQILRPTETGSMVLEKAISIIKLEDSIKAELFKQTSANEIKFCSTPTFWKKCFPQLLKRFTRESIEKNLCHFSFDHVLNVLNGLESDLYNIAFIEHCSELDLTSFKCFKFPDDEMVFVSSPSLGLSRQYISINDIKRFTLYGTSISSCSKTLLEKNLKKHGESINTFKNRIYCDDIVQILESVTDGQGICFISKSMVKEELNNGALICHKIKTFDHHKLRTLVVKQDYQLTGAPLLFFNYFFEMFGISPPLQN